MLDKIMIATDGSDASRHAASLAISLAKQSAGKVIAVYVVDIQSYPIYLATQHCTA